MEDLILVLTKAFFCGLAALGFGVLFNVPKRNLIIVGIGGVIAGMVKFSMMSFASFSIIPATFFAAVAVGIYSLFMANLRNEPQMIFTIPSVIPLVPGVFAYKTMIGLLRLTQKPGDDYAKLLSETVHNGAMTLFIVMAFSVGVIFTIQFWKRAGKRLLLDKEDQ